MRITFFALLLFAGLQVSAAPYIFTKATDAYQEIANPDFVIPDNSQYWNGGQILLKQDMTMKMFGQLFDFNEGIYMVMQQGYFYVYSTDGNHTVTFDNFAVDLQPRKGPSISEFSYKLEGGAGSKVLKLQFKNMGLLNGDETEYIDYQVWLHERGVIEVRFGKNNIQAASYAGKSGPAIGLLHMDGQFSTIYDEFYIQGDPSNPSTSTSAKYLSGTPVDGTVYRFEGEHVAAVNEAPDPINFSAYPNPVKDIIKINHPASAGGELSLTDLSGKVILQRKIEGFRNEESLDISALSAGVYVLTLSSRDEYKSIRVLKE